MKTSWLQAALLLALAARPAAASFEDLGAGARAPGMGNAFTALADDVYAIYYNPAGLAQLERPQFSTAYSRFYMGLSDGSDLSIMQLAYAQPLKGGRAGTFGTAWQRFGASSLYSEQTIHLSYGRLLWQRDSGSRLLGGLNFKQLKHSFGRPPEATNACGAGGCVNGDDPVLVGNNSKSTFDADLGFLYRFPRRIQLGLAAHHIMRPDVGFGAPEKLPMSLRAGAAYKSLWLSLMAEMRQEESPVGGQDRDFILAGERIFPTLTSGQFGLRGSMGFGSRDFQQLSVGLSYRVNKIQMDYAFLMPLGTVKGTQGTHRVSFGWHFGAPTADDEISKELLEQARQLREGRGPSYGYEYADELRPHSIEDPQLAEVRRLIEGRLYRQAHEAIVRLIQNQTPNPPLVRLANRLELASYYYADWSGPLNHWENVANSAVYNFIKGRDRKAILKGSYALSLSRNDAKFDRFLTDMEAAVGLKAERLPPDHPRSFVDELLFRVEAANSRQEFETVEILLQDILDLDQDNVTAIERVGSMYYILGRFQNAVNSWEKALSMETRPAEIESLRHHIQVARQRLGSGGAAEPALPREPGLAAPAGASRAPISEGGAGQGPAVPAGASRAPISEGGAQPPIVTPAPKVQGAAAPAAVTEPAQAAPAVVRPVRAPRPAQAATQASRSDPRDVERLFQKGVEHYARGEYLQATAMFMRILQIDPQNAQARKALDRIENKAPRRRTP